MRVSLLLQREPLPQIAASTIAAFWKSQFDIDFDVRWHARRSITSQDPRQRWLCNHLVNTIFRPGTSPDAFDPIVREFARSQAAWRRPLQQLYVYCALHPWTAPFLAHSHLTIAPDVPESHDWIIVPGNNKFRFLNHVKRLSYGMVKSQFPMEAVKCEIAARITASEHGVAIPELIETAQDGSWFCERYLSGTPANRLPYSSQALQFVKGAAEQLAHWSFATTTETTVQQYVGSMLDQLRQLLPRVVCATDRFDESVERVVEHLSAVACGGDTDESVLVAWTHGDFQDANILVSDRRVVVIDWEFAGLRQVDFDGLVYDLRSRFPTGLAERLTQYVQRGPRSDGLLAQVYHPQRARSASRESRTVQVAVFLLEELLLRIGQAADRPLLALPAGMESVVNEASRWLDQQAVCV